MVDVVIDGKSTLALIDTGASRTFISYKLVSRVTETLITRVGLGSTDASLAIQGAATVTLSVGLETKTIECLVARDLCADLILGMDWLAAEDAILDLRRRCLHFGTSRRVTVFFAKGRSKHSAATEAPPVDHGFVGSDAAAFAQLLRTFAAVFGEVRPMTTAPATTHRIELTAKTPIALPPHRHSPETKRAILRQVDEMLRNGIIEPTTSPYSSPVVMVKKKDGTQRFCVDFRRVNAVTITMPTVLPTISETLRDLGTAKVFSTIDLKSGYWQVPVDPTSRPITAFTTPDGAAYQFRVMPFGLKNAPGTFQRLMAQEVLSEYLRHFVLVYLDDIIVYSTNPEEHLYHLRLVFERLEQYGLKCSAEKCTFGRTSLKYLGFIVDEGMNRPDPDYIGKVLQSLRPANRRQLRAFLGTCNWIREYIPKFAELSAPLAALLSPRSRFVWTPTAEDAFQRIKEACAQPLALHRPDFRRPFVLQTDASAIGIAAVLYQEDQGRRLVVSYASATLTPTQRRYHCNEQECLAVVWATKKFRPYLEDREFILRTDSRALTWLDRTKEQKAKLTRWALHLQDLSFQVQHCPGRENELPDALSRQPQADIAEEPWDDDRLVPPTLRCLNAPTIMEEVAALQRQDRGIQTFIRRLGNLARVGPQGPGDRGALEYYTVENGLLWRRGTPNLLHVPPAAEARVLHTYHDAATAGHPGRDETVRAITRHFHWPSIQRTVASYVAECLICCATKRGPHQANAPQRPRQPVRPWEAVSVDIMGPYPRTPRGNRFLIVATDLHSRWIEAEPVATATTIAVQRFLEEVVFRRYGYPRTIISDNGPQFRCRRWRQACARWQARHWTTPIHHPRANPVERRNQELKKGLRVQLYGRRHHQWDLHVNLVLFQLRTRKNAATGVTPSMALFGFEIPRPGEWDTPAGDQRAAIAPADREEREAQIHQHQQRYARRYRGQGQPARYLPGDRVLTRIIPRAPLGPKWEGPHTVIEATAPGVYLVDQGGRPVRLHVDHIRPAPDADVPDDDVPDDDVPDADVPEADAPDANADVPEADAADSRRRRPRGRRPR